MNGYDLDDDYGLDDAYYGEDDLDDSEDLIDPLDDGFGEDDDPFGEGGYTERLFKRRKGRRGRKIRAGQVGRGQGLASQSGRSGGRYVTHPQFQAAVARIGKDIRRNGVATKRVVAQVNSFNKALADANKRQNEAIRKLRNDLKQQSQTAMMLTLMQPQPVLELVKGVNVDAAVADKTGELLGQVQVKKSDNMLPLMMMMMGSGSSGSSGSSGGDNNNMMMLAMVMMMSADKDN